MRVRGCQDVGESGNWDTSVTIDDDDDRRNVEYRRTHLIDVDAVFGDSYFAAARAVWVWAAIRSGGVYDSLYYLI